MENDADAFFRMGMDYINSSRPSKRIKENDMTKYISQFGTTPTVCAKVWNLIKTHDFIIDNGLTPLKMHLFYGLRLLKLYSSEEENADFFGCHCQTFRKWSWAIVIAISQTRHIVIRMDNRFLDYVDGNTALLTVDGTDFRINEPKPFSPEWFTHKFKGAGLRYEVAVAIQSGYICWTNGPFKPGLYNDISIFREDLIHELEDGEQVEADAGYAGEPEKIRMPQEHGESVEYYIMKGNARARHENVNACFKRWASLTTQFRHKLIRHANVFHAISVLTQLRIEEGGLIYGVDYDVQYT